MKFLSALVGVLMLCGIACATNWYQPPGGAATSVNGSDVMLVDQAGVSRTATVDQIRAGAGGTSAPAFTNLSTASAAKHTYWRITVTADNGNASWLAISDIQLHGTVGGPNLATGGTVTASSSVGTYPVGLPAGAFDGNTTTAWQTNLGGNPMPQWTQYQSPTPISVVEYSMTLNFDTIEAPRDWTLSWSDDGVNFTVVDARAGQTSWNYYQPNVYEVAGASSVDKISASAGHTTLSVVGGSLANVGGVPTLMIPQYTANNLQGLAPVARSGIYNDLTSRPLTVQDIVTLGGVIHFLSTSAVCNTSDSGHAAALATLAAIGLGSTNIACDTFTSGGTTGVLTMPSFSVSPTFTTPTLVASVSGVGSITMPGFTVTPTFTTPTLLASSVGSITIPGFTVTPTFTTPTLVIAFLDPMNTTTVDVTNFGSSTSNGGTITQSSAGQVWNSPDTTSGTSTAYRWYKTPIDKTLDRTYTIRAACIDDQDLTQGNPAPLSIWQTNDPSTLTAQYPSGGTELRRLETEFSSIWSSGHVAVSYWDTSLTIHQTLSATFNNALGNYYDHEISTRTSPSQQVRARILTTSGTVLADTGWINWTSIKDNGNPYYIVWGDVLNWAWAGSQQATSFKITSP